MGLDLPRLVLLLGYGIALLGAGSLVPHLPLLPRLALLIGLLAGLLAERRARPFIPHLALTSCSILLFLWYAVQFSRANPALPVVSILAVLLAARLAAEKTPRTWLQTSAIALFCLSASSLFDLGPRFLLLLALMLPMLALLLVLLSFQSSHRPLSPPDLRPIVTVGLLIPVAALLLTPLFFPILPRTQFPLWHFIQHSSGSQPAGLADTVTPGSSAQVPDSGQLVFRAEMSRLTPGQLYWRGPTFSRLDGLRWLRDPAAATTIARPSASNIAQVITMEPGSSRSLIGLDMPFSFSHPNGSSIPWATWNRPLPSSRRMRYLVLSTPVQRPATAPSASAPLTTLPETTPPRLLQLATDLRQTALTQQQRLTALETWFRSAGFRYSRTNLPTGPDALERFLFETRSGHCEFFASSFALLARGAGLPTRLVGGYYGGEYNELGGYYRVSEERAHVWVEVWLSGSGWLRIDPSSFAVNADVALRVTHQPSLTTRLRFVLDSLDHLWNSTIITYDFEQQLQAASSVQARLQSFRLRDLAMAAMLLSPALAVALLGLLCLRLHRRGRFNRSVRLLRRFRRIIEHDLGIPRSAQLGLFDIANQTRSPQVREFVELFAPSLYRQQPLTTEQYRRLKRLLHNRFKPL